jgi:hypothetical protein
MIIEGKLKRVFTKGGGYLIRIPDIPLFFLPIGSYIIRRFILLFSFVDSKRNEGLWIYVGTCIYNF